MSLIIIKEHIDDDEKKKIQDIEKKHLFHASKFCGILKWEIDPLRFQKEIRDEWKCSNRH
ncbi:MAG: hypothetical protein F9K48_07560 [Candidatus Brocadia sp.]|nr:MAG: hypothetical protein F9K48_07560 [Candidatus Brocadia sp.]